MRIGIDVQTTLGEKTGFGFYVKNLTENLKKIDKEDQYFFFRPKTQNELFSVKRFIWDQFQMPHQVKEKKVDILHQPCFSVPVFYSGKIIVTVHDLIAVKFGKDIHFGSRQFFGKWMPFSYKWADKIITVSQNSKKDIIKLLKIPEDKITVIYEAADESLSINRNLLEIEKIKKKYQIKGKYLLNLSTLNPRKNNQFLIKVFSSIVKEFKDYKLVITGKKGWYYEDLFKQVEELGLENKVIFTGYIDDQDKRALYNGASLFLFPSLYEGFGFTPLEAMTCGVPVICSNTSSLPEVVGNGGILLSPTDELGWIRSIKEILTNRVLKRRLMQAGLKQASKFSWGKCAKETIEVYRGVFQNED